MKKDERAGGVNTGYFAKKYCQLYISIYPHDEREQKSYTGTSVHIIEPRLLYQWALASSLFEAPQMRPSLRRNCTRYIS